MVAYIYQYEAERVSFYNLQALNSKLAAYDTCRWVQLLEDGRLLSDEVELDTADLDFFEGAAALIALHLRQERIRIVFRDEEGYQWGFDIYPDRVETLETRLVLVGRVDLKQAVEELC